MASITFDTFAYAKRLKAAGFTEQQAEAHTLAQKQVLSEVLHTSHATKDDNNRLEKQIALLDKQLTLLKWMAGILLAGVSSLILKAFFISRFYSLF